MALITISDLELYLQKTITGTTDEDKYEYIIGAVLDAADTLTCRNLEEQSYIEEKYDGNGCSEIYLNNYPVTSINSVEYGSVLGGGTRTTVDQSYYLREDEIGRVIFGFESADIPQVFSISYTAGYSVDPSNYTLTDDLKTILLEQVENMFNKLFTSSDIKSEKLGDYSYTKFSVSEMDNTSIFAEKLNPWKNRNI